MERFSVPIPYGEDFPQVICAQRNGEDFKKEFVEYVPRWKFDKCRQVMVVDRDAFFALADTAGTLERMLGNAEADNAKLREFATETWELLTCNEPVIVWKGLQELARNLGIEVDE